MTAGQEGKDSVEVFSSITVPSTGSFSRSSAVLSNPETTDTGSDGRDSAESLDVGSDGSDSWDSLPVMEPLGFASETSLCFDFDLGIRYSGSDCSESCDDSLVSLFSRRQLASSSEEMFLGTSLFGSSISSVSASSICLGTRSDGLAASLLGCADFGTSAREGSAAVSMMTASRCSPRLGSCFCFSEMLSELEEMVFNMFS
mmetsp:Transcript_20655/g.43255  ORF Transcript_20655/g.43255 Transcript_20655/m.43255 type:complete len:201 (+) Transcript_20655:2336-2938(+)